VVCHAEIVLADMPQPNKFTHKQIDHTSSWLP
jgi:hypothetical protein